MTYKRPIETNKFRTVFNSYYNPSNEEKYCMFNDNPLETDDNGATTRAENIPFKLSQQQLMFHLPIENDKCQTVFNYRSNHIVVNFVRTTTNDNPIMESEDKIYSATTRTENIPFKLSQQELMFHLPNENDKCQTVFNYWLNHIEVNFVRTTTIQWKVRTMV